MRIFPFGRRSAGKSPYPLSKPVAIAKTVDELTKRDSPSALQSISELLDGLKTARGMDLVHVFELLDQLDRVGRPHWRKATHEYFVDRARRTNYEANRIWTSVGEYVVQLAEAYEFCLASYATGASGSPALASQFVRLVGRALRLRASAHSFETLSTASSLPP